MNEAFVEKLGLGDNPVGKHVRVQGSACATEIEIVGVVADARFAGVKRRRPPQFFTPRPRGDTVFGSLFFFVRSELNAESLLSADPARRRERGPEHAGRQLRR